MTKEVRTCYRNVPITMRKILSGYLMFHLPKEVLKAKIFFMSHLFLKALYNYILQKYVNIMTLLSTLNRSKHCSKRRI